MAHQPAFPGLILAGGAARRMGGRDKALLRLAGRPLLAHVLERLAPQVAMLAISANGDPSRFATFGLTVLADPSDAAGAGPLAGLLAGLDWAASGGAAALVTVAVDTPSLPADLVRRLADAARGGIAVAAAPGPDGPERHPTAGLWPTRLRDALRSDIAAGVRRLGGWAEAHGAREAWFPDPDGFLNVNAPADLVRAEAMLTR